MTPPLSQLTLTTNIIILNVQQQPCFHSYLLKTNYYTEMICTNLNRDMNVGMKWTDQQTDR